MNEFQDIPKASFDFICRMCLMYSENFAISDINWEDISLKSVIYICSSIQVEENNRMPKNMCKVCIKKMHETYRFLTQCKNSNNILKYVLSKNVINTSEETNKFTKITTETKVKISNEVESESEDIDNHSEYLPDVHDYNLDDPEEIKSENSEPDEKINNDENPNDKLINKIQTLKNEIKEIKVKTKDRLRKMQKAQLVSANEVPRPKRAYIKTKGPPYSCIICHALFQDYEDFQSHKIETKHRKAGKFTCPYCQKRHNAYSRLLEHVRTHTGEKPNKCPTCGKGFNCKTDLRRHMVLHSEVRPYNCQFCNKGFTRKQYLTDHERKHTGERLICSFCGKGCHSYFTLWYHEKTHKGLSGCSRNENPMGKDKNYQCHMCEKVLLTEQTLKSHILLHGPKNFSCEKCGKTYISKYRLQDHIGFAHQDTKFPCSLCDKVYKQKGTLDIHIKSHTGENIYACEVCNKHFACKGSLFQHRRVHTGDTRYQCKECFRICINKRNLESHLRTHTGEKPFACMHCDKAFAQKANLSAHIKIHTGEKKHLCRICGKGFYNGRSLKKHMTVHEKADEV